MATSVRTIRSHIYASNPKRYSFAHPKTTSVRTVYGYIHSVAILSTTAATNTQTDIMPRRAIASRALSRGFARKATSDTLQERVVALCRHRGFVFPGSDLYGGLANSFDYGPLGTSSTISSLSPSIFVYMYTYLSIYVSNYLSIYLSI